ncbi:helicase SNF2 [Kitasatospora sp. MMS16-BH015]|uniref:DEAD/DEAH box helicase n=1 Tax=Kitasatospora sp. MMS16-BH015 TaxID=2018025 RepID=UPI000CA222B5|nr:DEAD/DEAH box helicase [Kitasatospora sp. MMS16-BH015]AUG75511.1 helicase SNF2 [Kitasatospora sp. MMS16-BH015]
MGERKPKAVLAEAERLLASAQAVLAEHEAAVVQVRQGAAALRDRLVGQELAALPVARLKDVTDGRLRVAALEQAGYRTVRQVLEASGYDLRLVPGIGQVSADQALAAARQLAEAVGQTVAVRVDPDRRDEESTALLSALARLVAAGPEATRARKAAALLSEELSPLTTAARPAGGVLRGLFAGKRGRAEAAEAVGALTELLAEAAEQQVSLAFDQTVVDLLRPPAQGDSLWLEFETRSADFYGVLGELVSDGRADYTAAAGFLPDDLVQRVQAEPLTDELRGISLRGYQAFGARFALAQRRAILGDEMGLGKTVQAVAVLSHLKAAGGRHFLVVCPASVLVNWVREVEARSSLRAYRYHGPERSAALAAWSTGGGVLVATFDGLRRLAVPADLAVGQVVVDEAHYVKNPATRRAQAVAHWAGRVDRVLFLTGTPMENRVEEFRSLVAHLQPELLPRLHHGVGAVGPDAFRKAVAPVYLRRNQRDVLTELPETVQVDEWEEFSAGDAAAYRTAVAAGNFMAMRRAGYAEPKTSAKLERLAEIVAEAEANGLKVVVFSYFREVLATVQEGLKQRVFGPIDGGMPAERRQEVVDEYSAVAGHAVLLSQIQAGGVGLNMQAASVVIICEPQVKPTLESQAVARAHRMGQVRRVQVHRLLAEDSVDQRMVEMLRGKSRLFDAYARRSEVAENSPEAVDVSERSLAVRIVEEEQLRLAAEG